MANTYLDAVKNFAIVTVSTGYASGATSVALSSGHGAKLPAPATDGNFNLVWWNSTDYANPADDPNVEIVRCTARSTDTLTITRAQEGTSDVNHNTADKTYKMILSPTAKMISDIDTYLPKFASGVTAALNTSSNADNDVAVTLTFQPKVIILYYSLQGRLTSGTTYTHRKGIAVYNTSGTLIFDFPIWYNDTPSYGLASDQGVVKNINSGVFSADDTAAPATGSSSAGRKIILSIPSIGATGFTIRRVTSGNDGNAVAEISYVAFG